MHGYRALGGILGALPIFESAARLLSFTKAAQELDMTQPAVSRRISGLEDLLGVAVFQRSHNKVVLTHVGKELFLSVELGLGDLIKTINRLSRLGKDSPKLTIACGFSFAVMWFRPRFSRFRRMLDDSDVHLIASEYLDQLTPRTIDIRILWQDDYWPDRDVRPLFQENVCAVCSPIFAKQHGLSLTPDNSPESLSTIPLLHNEPLGSNCLGWHGWFQRNGVDYVSDEQVYLYDSYQYAIDAALENEGLALGYKFLIESELDRGTLVQVGPSVHHQDAAIFIEFEIDHLSEDVRDMVYGWFLDELSRSGDTIS